MGQVLAVEVHFFGHSVAVRHPVNHTFAGCMLDFEWIRGGFVQSALCVPSMQQVGNPEVVVGVVLMDDVT